MRQKFSTKLTPYLGHFLMVQLMSCTMVYTKISSPENSSEGLQSFEEIEDGDLEDFRLSSRAYLPFDPSQLHVSFEFNSAKITPKEYPRLQKVVQGLKQDPLARLVIQGHTDKQGSAQYNRRLRKKRALAIQIYLTKQGIPEYRIETVHEDTLPRLDQQEKFKNQIGFEDFADQPGQKKQEPRRGDFTIDYSHNAFGN